MGTRGRGHGLMRHVVECSRQVLDFSGGEFACLEFLDTICDILRCIKGIFNRHMGDLGLFVRWWAFTFALVYLS